MEYADLKAQRKSDTAWRLLTSPHAPLIASFFYQVFIKPNQRSLAFDIAASKLDDLLYHLNQLYGEKTFPKSANQYLDDWAGGSSAFLRKYYALEIGSNQVKYLKYYNIIPHFCLFFCLNEGFYSEKLLFNIPSGFSAYFSKQCQTPLVVIYSGLK